LGEHFTAVTSIICRFIATPVLNSNISITSIYFIVVGLNINQYLLIFRSYINILNL